MGLLSKSATALLILGWLGWIVICEVIRSQVNERLAPEHQFQKFQSSLGSRWWGRDGLWNMHAKFYPNSHLRMAFWIDVAVIVGAVVLTLLAPAPTKP